MKLTRRSALQISAAAAVPAPVAVASVPANHILHKGKLHPVNAHWHEANTAKWPHLAALSREDLEAQGQKLLRLADERRKFGGRLSQDERAYLRAVNNHFNVRTSVTKLKGRDHREFDFEGVDQLHFNSVGLSCGCELEHVFDHHSGLGQHAHHPLNLCASHEHLRGRDLAELREQVLADNREA